MKATFTTRPEKYTNSHRKEDKLSKQYAGVVIDDGKIREAVTVRIYATDSRAYACVWVHGGDRRAPEHYRHGSGYAGGYGYHRGSAAVSDAIEHCGIDLDEAIDGRGEGAIKEAVLAIIRTIYDGNEAAINSAVILEAHG